MSETQQVSVDEELTPYTEEDYNATEANYDISRPILETGPAIVKVLNASYQPPKGKQIGGKFFLSKVLVVEGTQAQVGHITSGSVDLPVGIFDDPPEGSVQRDAAGHLMLTKGQRQNATIRAEGFKAFVETFGLPTGPAGKNQDARKEFIEAILGVPRLCYLGIDKGGESTDPVTGQKKTYDDRQKISGWRPNIRLHPKKGAVDEVEAFRTKLGARLVQLSEDADSSDSI